MFFDGDRIVAMREMILADDEADRKAALAKLVPYQRQDFVGIFEAMNGLPVTIRLLDPPLHEFLPHDEQGQAEVAKQLGIAVDEGQAPRRAAARVNPMLGHRGCRLPIVYPEILDMQVAGDHRGGHRGARRRASSVLPEIMIPLVGTVEELTHPQEAGRSPWPRRCMKKAGVKVEYLIGTMIEVPAGRA